MEREASHFFLVLKSRLEVFLYLAVLNNLEYFWGNIRVSILISCTCTKLELHFKWFLGYFHICSPYSSFTSIVFALNLCTTFPTVLMLYGDDDDDDDDEGDDDDNYDLFMWNDWQKKVH